MFPDNRVSLLVDNIVINFALMKLVKPELTKFLQPDFNHITSSRKHHLNISFDTILTKVDH